MLLISRWAGVLANHSISFFQNQPKTIFRPESDRIAQQFSFIQSYKRSEASVHIYGAIRVIRTKIRVRFCVAVQCLVGSTLQTFSASNALRFSNTRSDDIQVSILVDC
jgi:hypothetical protein